MKSLALLALVLGLLATVPAAEAGFTLPVNYETGSTPQSVAVGDFNGDGKPDLAVANFDILGFVTIFLGNGNGTFAYGGAFGSTFGAYASVTVGDFNGD